MPKPRAQTRTVACGERKKVPALKHTRTQKDKRKQPPALKKKSQKKREENNSPVGFLFFLRLLPQRHCSICDPLLKMLLQINRMDLAETGEEEEEVAVEDVEKAEEEEEVGDERRSRCGSSSSLKFTHRMGAGPPPCLHASRGGQLSLSARQDSLPPRCTIDRRSRSRQPGHSPASSPLAFSAEPGGSGSGSSCRTYSASSSPRDRKRATAVAEVTAAGALLSSGSRSPTVAAQEEGDR